MKILYTKLDIRDYFKDEWVVVTTNGCINKKKEAVMGKGIAKVAADTFPSLPKKLGELLLSNGNHTYFFPEYKIITCPTKINWKHASNVELLQRSFKELCGIIEHKKNELILDKVYCPLLGCGNGGLTWEYVSTLIYNDYYPLRNYIIFFKIDENPHIVYDE